MEEAEVTLTALAFAESGAQIIIITSRGESSLTVVAAEITELGSESKYFIADAADHNRSQEVFVVTKTEFGSIDVVVNNAGYLPDHALIKDARLNDWWTALDINTKGGFIAIQAFIQHASPGAALISIVTTFAHTTYYPEFSSYGASKLAMIKLMQDVHVEHQSIECLLFNQELLTPKLHPKATFQSKIQVNGSYCIRPGLYFGAPRLAGILYTVNLPAGFSLWLASTEFNFVRGRMVWAKWDVDELKAK